MDKISGLEYYLSVLHDPLFDLSITNRSLRLPPVDEFEGRHTNSSMMVVVITKLYQWKVRVPDPNKIIDASISTCPRVSG